LFSKSDNSSRSIATANTRIPGLPGQSSEVILCRKLFQATSNSCQLYRTLLPQGKTKTEQNGRKLNHLNLPDQSTANPPRCFTIYIVSQSVFFHNLCRVSLWSRESLTIPNFGRCWKPPQDNRLANNRSGRPPIIQSLFQFRHRCRQIIRSIPPISGTDNSHFSEPQLSRSGSDIWQAPGKVAGWPQTREKCRI